MTSLFIFAIGLIAILTAAMTVLTLRILADERRATAARAARLKQRALPVSAIVYSLGDRRQAARADVLVERRRAA